MATEADETTPVRGVRYQPWKPITGPVDRVSYFDEQGRHRRATWRLSIFCTLAVLLTGIPVSLVLTPVVHTVALLVLALAGQFVRVPDAAWQWYRSLFLVIFDTVEQLDQQPIADQLPGLVLAAALLVLPGVAAMGLMWVWLGRVFARSGVGGILLTLGAREPRPDDLEERQLVNVVEEMAIAAGVPPPRVMMLDADVANAAAIGSSSADATVVVSRRLLDEVDRDDTQGVLGHLVAAIGNGDLRIAFTVVRVFQTYGLATSVLSAPFSSKARATLWQLARYSLRPGGQPGAEAELIMQMLASNLSDVDMDDVDKVLGDEARRVKGIASIPLKVRVFALFPLWFAGSLAKIVLMMLTSFVLEPLVAHMWRTRRYLADATAVQLTRDPDGLASALRVLARTGGVLPGGRWAVHLFIVGTPTFHPPLGDRLRRLRALGASVEVSERPRFDPRSFGQRGVGALLWLVIGPLLLLATGLGVVAITMMMMLVLGAIMMYLGILFAIFWGFG